MWEGETYRWPNISTISLLAEIRHLDYGPALAIPTLPKLLVTLRLLDLAAFQRIAAYAAGMSQSSVTALLVGAQKAALQWEGHHICFPQAADEISTTKVDFFSKQDSQMSSKQYMEHVGPVIPPSEYHCIFWNRKHTDFINACNAQCLITNVAAKFPAQPTIHS